MSYCLNPACPQPQNPDHANFCQACGSTLWLGDRYRALHPMAQGGFGRTLLAVDEYYSGHSFCVIKQFFPNARSFQNRQKAAELFRQEAERLKHLGQHPQIPQLLDYIEQADGQYLIQAFIEGKNLEQRLATTGPWSEEQVRSLLQDLLPVLQYIHQAQVIHRDIKPENIILPVGNGPPVLVDFGASKVATETGLARTGTVIGSAGYVAPEQALGKAVFASDLYSLGVTCIHLLTGMHPFDLYSVAEDAWVWRQYLPSPVSSQLSHVLNRMICKATRQRYETAEQVLADLYSSSARSPSRTPARSRLPRRASARVPIRQRGQQTSRTTRPQSSAPAAVQAQTRPSTAAQTWDCWHTLTEKTSGITCLAVSSDGSTLAAGGIDGAIRLWNLETGEFRHTLSRRTLWFGDGHSDQISGMIFHPDGYTLLSSSYDGTVKRWDLLQRKVIATLSGQGWLVAAIALSEDGHILASSHLDGTIGLWDLERETLIQTLKPDPIRGVASANSGFWSDNRGIALGEQGTIGLAICSLADQLISSDDKALQVWDLQGGQQVDTLTAHADRVSCLAVSADEQTLVSGSWDCTVKVWHLPTRQLDYTLAKHRDRMTAVAISPDGTTLATGSEDSTIQLWDLQAGEWLTTLHHTWGIRALAFAPNSQVLVSSSTDETVKIWRRQ